VGCANAKGAGNRFGNVYQSFHCCPISGAEYVKERKDKKFQIESRSLKDESQFTESRNS